MPEITGLVMDDEQKDIADAEDQEISSAISILQKEQRDRENELESQKTVAHLQAMRDGDENHSPPYDGMGNMTDADVTFDACDVDPTWGILTFPKVTTTTGIEQKFWGGLVTMFAESVELPMTQRVMVKSEDPDVADEPSPDKLRCMLPDAITLLERLNEHLA